MSCGTPKRLATGSRFKSYKPESEAYDTYKNKRLDWILITKDMQFENYQVLPDTLSDHAMVVADISFKVNPSEPTKKTDTKIDYLK